MTILWTDTNKASTQEWFVIFYRVDWCHNRIHLSMIGKDGHVGRRTEWLLDIILSNTVFTHHPVTLTLTDGAVEDLLYLGRSQVIGIRCILLIPVLLIERWLEELHHMLIGGILSVFLHTRVDGGMHAQAIGIDAIRLTILLLVFVAPTVQRIWFPINWVNVILHHIPRSIQSLFRFLGHHITTQEITEIGSNTILMIADMEMQLDGFCTIFLVVSLWECTSLHHLSEHHISTLTTPLWISDGIIIRRVLTESNQGGSLIDRQILRLLAEISIWCRLDTNRIMKEVKIIQIHRDNLILRIIAFQLDSDNPFYRLLKHTLHGSFGMLRIQLLSQLLGNGRATTRTLLSHDTAFDDGTCQSIEVDTWMLIETDVLSSHQCLYQCRWQFGIIHQHAVLTIVVPRTQQFSIGWIYLRGITVDRILQILDGWHITNPSLINRIKCSGSTQHYQYQ